MCCLPFNVGATPAISRENLLNWIDTVVGNVVTTVATNRVLGGEQPGVHLRGFYQMLTQRDVDIVEAKMANNSAWIHQCGVHNHSAGRYMLISKDEGEKLRMINKALGIFQTTRQI